MGKKKRKTFKDFWKNQSELGELYGKSAVAVGKALSRLGLKDPETGEATPIALEQGIAKATPLANGTPFYLWNLELATPALDTLEDWRRLTKDDRLAKDWAAQYVLAVNEALQADGNGDSFRARKLYKKVDSLANQIHNRSPEFAQKAALLMKGKVPAQHQFRLFETEQPIEQLEAFDERLN